MESADRTGLVTRSGIHQRKITDFYPLCLRPQKGCGCLLRCSL
ncbi:hypothetical protein SynA1560_01295 [Synechococcus sp. A15-60]|nr:hypothetical protein SynA1560_01295 [Synechococcus sp. A15-60]